LSGLKSPYTIRYGDDRIAVNIPDDVAVDVVSRREFSAKDESSVLSGALQSPLSAPSLHEFLSGADAPLVIVNDATRSTPTARILDAIWGEVSKCPEWRIIIASGLHRGPTEAELKILFGSRLPEILPRLLVHDGYDDTQLVTVDSPMGPIRINTAVLEADRIIVINSVEPHFFAGYTGGRKSIIPGVAGFETVERSHAGAVTAQSSVLRVEGNPVREFIHAGSRFLDDKTIWSIQTVLDKHDKIAAAFAGDIDKTFEAARSEAWNCYVVEIEQPYDIVIGAIHPPLDLSLYQAMKGWELPMAGVRDGGVLIMTAPCREGVGARFYKRLIEEYPDRTKWGELESKPYTLGLHKLVRTARAVRRFRLFAITGMPADEVQRYGYQPFDSVDAAMTQAVDYVGTPARLLIVEDSAVTTIVRKHDPIQHERVRLKTESERFDI
jgi:nickel-dependent lactate racemase